jgi:hypothetical protein
MIIPQGVITSKTNQVCKLQKSLYGLKQASMKWYEKLTSLLLAHQYIQSTSDHSLFIKKTATTFTVMLVYVDDVIIAGDLLLDFNTSNPSCILHLKLKILGN